MKRRWLRGVLLGVSLALLLAGGVVLAQGLRLTVDKECVPCYPGAPQQGPPAEEYALTLTAAGWDPAYALCQKLTVEGQVVNEGCYTAPPIDPSVSHLAFPCTLPVLPKGLSVLGAQVDTSTIPITSVLGEWTMRAWQTETGQSAEVSWLVAEVCEAEFVPEPGTLMLLGSGLAGLAGYATLRWRTRE